MFHLKIKFEQYADTKDFITYKATFQANKVNMGVFRNKLEKDFPDLVVEIDGRTIIRIKNDIYDSTPIYVIVHETVEEKIAIIKYKKK